MVGMAIDRRFQSHVREVCESCRGEFYPAPMKGYQRMKEKCLSKDDHYYKTYPRPGHNLDVIRCASTFETASDLTNFAIKLSSRREFCKQPVRVKNMFLFDDQQAEDGLHYRTIMINWLYTPGITYHDMVQESGVRLWQSYFDYMEGRGIGKKAPSVSWCEWRERIDAAMTFLMNVKWKKRPVQFIVETQLLLRPYMDGREKMHFMYKIIRCANPKALFNEFRICHEMDDTSQPYMDVQKAALREVDETLKKMRNSWTGHKSPEAVVNELLDWSKITLLGKHCRAGNKAAVEKLLGVPELDVNLPTVKGETPLYHAAWRGHYEIVDLLLKHKHIAPNDTNNNGGTPLHIAASKGYTTTVHALLKHPKTNVNLAAVSNGITPLYVAAQQGHTEIVAMLLAMKEIDVNTTRPLDSTTPLYSAVCYGHREIVSLLCTMPGIDVNRASTGNVTPLGMALYLIGNPHEIHAAYGNDAILEKQRMLSGCDAIANAEQMFADNAPLKYMLDVSKKKTSLRNSLRNSARGSSQRGLRLGAALGSKSTLKKRMMPKPASVEEERMFVAKTLLQHRNIRLVVHPESSFCTLV
jgi:ankyrin repeat protein